MSDNPSDKRTQALSELAAMDAYLLDPVSTHPKQVEGVTSIRAAIDKIQSWKAKTADDDASPRYQGDIEGWNRALDEVLHILAPLSRQTEPVSAPTLSDTKEGMVEALAEQLRVLAAKMVQGRAGISAQWLIDAASLLTSLKAQLDEALQAASTEAYENRRLRKKIEILEQVYVDEFGTTWNPPTAPAYAAVCKARTKYADRAETAEAELSRVKEERDSFKAMASGSMPIANQHMAKWIKENQALEAEISRLKQRMEGMEKALEPWARYAKRELDKEIPRHIQDDPSTPILGSGMAYEHDDAIEVTVADFQALAALSNPSQGVSK